MILSRIHLISTEFPLLPKIIAAVYHTLYPLSLASGRKYPRAKVTLETLIFWKEAIDD